MKSTMKIVAMSVLLPLLSCLGQAELKPAFSFVYEQQEIRSLPDTWTTSWRAQSGRGLTKEFTTATHPGGNLSVTLEVIRYQEFPVTEWQLVFTNPGEGDSGRLSRISAADCRFVFKDGDLAVWHGVGEGPSPEHNYYFRRTPIADGQQMSWSAHEGYPCYSSFPFFRLAGVQEGYAVAVGWEGQWQASATRKGNELLFQTGQQTVDFYLKPGEKAISPRITVLEYENADDAVNLWRRWFREYILPHETDGRPLRPRLVADGHETGELYTESTIGQQLAMVRKIRAKGIHFDSWWMDAGWYVRELRKNPPVGNWFLTGDWTADPKRFPQALKPLSEELAKDGASLTLWYEPERVHEGSPVLENVRPFLSPYKNILSYRYNLADEKTVEHLIQTIGKSLEDNGVGIYRQDSNGEGPLNYWRASEEARKDGRHGMVENQAIQGMERFWKGLKQRRPGLVIDVCASGGRRNNLETFRRGAVPLHYSDVGYFDFIAKQRYHHVLNQWFLYYKNISQHFHDGDKLNLWKAVIDIAPFQTIYGKYVIKEDNGDELKFIELWRKLGDLQVDGDYYLLTPEVFGADQWWITQFHDPKTSRGFLQVVRNAENKDEQCPVTLRGFKTSVSLKLTNLCSGESLTQQASKSLVVSLKPGEATVVYYEP